ncbi:Microfibrillar-associated protein 1 [Cichlidogyrus casuarinus]|uniref:Microfibrillar-associated protein 1 n=1 Tax=Cichlidogyrus casuarinus TaxID=1844966 RepID=A0ABD2Q877_9PLAT
MSKNRVIANQVLSTAGAIPIKQKKGDVYMQKVKVQRYVAGKRPDYAPSSSEEEDEEFEEKKLINNKLDRKYNEEYEAINELIAPTEEELMDPRIRRIYQKKVEIHRETKPSSDVDEDEDIDDEVRRITLHRRIRAECQSESDEEENTPSSDEDEVLTEEQLEAKRRAIRAMNLQIEKDKEKEETFGSFGPSNEALAEKINELEDEDIDDELVYSDEGSEYTSSEDEDSVAPRLKPVFVRKKDRVTLQAKDKEEQKELQSEYEKKRLANERRNATLKMVEQELKREAQEARRVDDALDAIDSDEGAGDPGFEQMEYERWKVRELRRIRRDREAREALTQEKVEVERIHNMTEEERLEEFRRNPKKVTNVAEKGRYKFLQKYYHRGAFFVTGDEDDIYKRNFAEPTLEDKFDKSKLPSVMQVKNFGLAGRTKYTHLVDQDTTEIDSAWAQANPQASKFQSNYGGGFKEIFEKPTISKKKSAPSSSKR